MVSGLVVSGAAIGMIVFEWVIFSPLYAAYAIKKGSTGERERSIERGLTWDGWILVFLAGCFISQFIVAQLGAVLVPASDWGELYLYWPVIFLYGMMLFLRT